MLYMYVVNNKLIKADLKECCIMSGLDRWHRATHLFKIISDFMSNSRLFIGGHKIFDHSVNVKDSRPGFVLTGYIYVINNVIKH